MGKVRVRQVRSRIGSTARQKRTLDALGLRKINSTVEIDDTPGMLGMVEKVKHLVTIEKL